MSSSSGLFARDIERSVREAKRPAGRAVRLLLLSFRVVNAVLRSKSAPGRLESELNDRSNVRRSGKFDSQSAEMLTSPLWERSRDVTLVGRQHGTVGRPRREQSAKSPTREHGEIESNPGSAVAREGADAERRATSTTQARAIELPFYKRRGALAKGVNPARKRRRERESNGRLPWQ